MAKRQKDADEPVWGKDPFADDVVATEFFGAPRTKPAPAKAAKPKPEHYKVVSISLYTEDIERLDEMVRSLKSSGHRRANRSALIRFALDSVDVSKMPKGY